MNDDTVKLIRVPADVWRQVVEALELDDANHDTIQRWIRHFERALDGTHQQSVADTLLAMACKLETIRDSRSAALEAAKKVGDV
jgi:hypothetical protein